MENLVEGSAVTALTIGIVQILKGLVPTRFVPLTAVLVGIVVSNANALAQGTDWLTATVAGVVVGLTAAGTYDVVTGIAVEGKKKK